MAEQATNHESDRLGENNQETRRLGESYTIREAAGILRTTVDGIRGRIRRGTLDSMKVDGQVYVLLDPVSREQHTDKVASSADTEGDDGRLTDSQSQLVGELREQVAWLRREVERKDTIIMSLTQRIPELEAPSELQDAPETATEGPDKGRASQESQKPSEQRSWLSRFFFGP